MAQDTMTPTEAAAYLHLGVETVKRKAREGVLPAAKTGRKWLFRKTELDAWLDAGGDLSAEDRYLSEEIPRRMADPENAVRIPLAQAKRELGL
jgi:excisionase family DNA binding protein